MKEIEEMLQVNEEQAKFYDSISLIDDNEEQTGYAKHDKANLLTRIWAKLRYNQQEAFTESGLEVFKEKFHQKIIDKKLNGDFLEIGCFRGTRSSWPLIESAKNYTGIDLSSNAIKALNTKIENAGLSKKAKSYAVDFLTLEENTKYDLIFAHGVLHHFKNPDPMFNKINNLLKPGGVLLLTEPSEVNIFYSFLRKLYRPFQSDSDWEFPFNSNTIKALNKYLQPLDGFGWGKYSLLLSILTGIPLLNIITKPIYLRVLKSEIKKGWHNSVWWNSTITAVYKSKNNAN
jgi:SAM-dependent methyltransferase